MREPKDVYINGVSLDEILQKHEMWANDESGGKAAHLQDVNFKYANLKNVNLKGMNLSYIDLSYTNLEGADLQGTNLKGAKLQGAILKGAILCRANLNYANLSYANLKNANLDMSSIPLCCGSLRAGFDEKHLIQMLFHVGMPYYSNKSIVQDKDLKELLGSDLFKMVANKFNKTDECGRLENGYGVINKTFKKWGGLTDKEQDMALDSYVEEMDLDIIQSDEIFDYGEILRLLEDNLGYSYVVSYFNGEVNSVKIY